MKVLIIFAVLCFLQAIAGQVTKEESKTEHPKQENQVRSHIAGHKDEEKAPQQNSNNEQHIPAQNQHVEQQQVAELPKPTLAIPHHPSPSKESIEKPSKIQHVAGQGSQQVASEIDNKHRVARSVKNRLVWQDMQVNAVEQPGKCEYICNPLDLSVCGYNGRCHWEFESQCDLSTYNCLNTATVFHVVDFAKCQDVGAAKCYRGDL